jgi:hypothetical protein
MNVGNDVGLHVGFVDLPDSICTRGIKGLSVACRKCRVSRGEDSPGEIANLEAAGPGMQRIVPTYSFVWT